MRRDQKWWDGPWPWLAYLVFYGLPWLWREPSLTELLASGLGGAAFLGVYILTYRASGVRLMAAVATISSIGILLAPAGGGWTVFAFFGAMQAARLRPGRLAVGSVLAVVCAYAVAGVAFGQPFVWWLPSLLTALLMGGATLSREALFDRTQTLLATQEEVRRLAVAVERERMARDVHDLVGRTLTLVALKADLANRLLGSDSQAAGAEIRGIRDAARSGLAEVRGALTGQTGGNLEHEIVASVAALKAAGVAVEVSGHDIRSSGPVGALLAMTLREGVTNVIRHAGATRCRIEVSATGDQACLTVSDNGPGGAVEEGAGLTGMRQRLMAAGGALNVRSDGPGVRLIAVVPL